MAWFRVKFILLLSVFPWLLQRATVPNIVTIVRNEEGRSGGGLIGGTMISASLHRGMVHPQVAEGGTASDMEGTCEYTE